MDALLRLILRFIVVPLGYLAAVVAGTLIILFGSWHAADVAAAADPDRQAIMIFGFVFAAPILLVTLMSVMWLPAAIGVLIAETFAIRSWMFHVANGAVSAWVGWNLFGYIDDSHIPLNRPLPVIAAGLAGGFAYWAIAGWSAGFWKPVFRHEPVAGLPSVPQARGPGI
jgi:hypothetical protein